MTPPWFDPTESAPKDVSLEDVDRWRHFQAWTRFRAAQDEALRQFTERPVGVSVFQFLNAHGFAMVDVGTARVAHLVI